MKPGVSVPQAARELGKSQSTVRHWIRDGAPTISLGQSGRGRGSRVDVQALRAWRAGGEASRDDAATLASAAAGIRAAFAANAPGLFQPAHAVLGVKESVAARLFCHAFSCVAQQQVGYIPSDDQLPVEIKDLLKIAQTAHK